MKRIALVLSLLLLSGCASADREMEQALTVRSRLANSGCSFRCEITADYIDTVEEFALDCSMDTAGELTFSVVRPETISDITGKVTAEEGMLTFDDTVLAFPLMADDRLSPVSSPWILIQTLRAGYITACVREEELLHLTVDDSYADDALTLEVWLEEDGAPAAAEISWQGRRVVSMQVEDFAYL